MSLYTPTFPIPALFWIDTMAIYTCTAKHFGSLTVLVYYASLACLFICMHNMGNANEASQGYSTFTNCFLGIVKHSL